MNIPNALSFLRIIIAFIAPFFLINGSKTVSIIAGIFCVIAIATDYFDGWYARKYNEITTLGKILDPIADKALILISFSVLVYLDTLSIWWVIPIFIREIAVTVYRFIFLSKNIVVAAAKSGKVKTVMQMLTLGITYVYFMTKKFYKGDLKINFGAEGSEMFLNVFEVVLVIALVYTVFLTIQSGYLFFKSNWQTIKRFHQTA